MNNYVRKSSPRLSEFNYEGYNSYFITCCTSRNKQLFKNKKLVDSVCKILFKEADKQGFKIHCYCFMPDHLHLLLSGLDQNSSLKKFMKSFKQKSSYQFKQKTGEVLWQRSYYDHVVRKMESLQEIAEYILDNPVRQGIVDNYKDYPFWRLEL